MSERLRVAHLVSHPVHYFAPLYRELARRPEIDLTVYFYAGSGVSHADLEFGRDVRWDVPLLGGYRHRFCEGTGATPIASSSLRPNPWIARDVAAGGYDVVWMHGYAHATSWVAGGLAYAGGAALLLRDEQTLLHDRTGPRAAIRSMMLRALMSRASAAYIGEANRRFLRAHGMPEQRMYPARYCVDNARLRRDAARVDRDAARGSFGINDGEPVVLFCGKLIDKKQPLRVIDAFARVRAQQACHLLVVGDGPLRRESEALVSYLGVPDVHFAGFINQGELARAYAAADVFVLASSLHETWGLVVNEAMNFELPIVVSDRVGCVEDLVQRGENGFVVPHADTEALASAIAALVADPAMRAAFGARSRQIVDGYSIEACADGIVDACLGAVTRTNTAEPPERRARRMTWKQPARAA